MPWFKVDDNLAFHHKVIAAGNAAMGVWVRAGAMCANQLTDGFVPEHMVTQLGGKAAADRLVTAGLWRRVEGGYQFHEWEERQPSREQVEAERAAARERMAKARQRKRSGEVRPNTERTSDDVRLTPTRPDPTRPSVPAEQPPTGGRKRPATRLPDDWAPSEKHALLAAELGVDVVKSSLAFRDHAKANDKRQVDWEATFRTWLRNDAEWGRNKASRQQEAMLYSLPPMPPAPSGLSDEEYQDWYRTEDLKRRSSR